MAKKDEVRPDFGKKIMQKYNVPIVKNKLKKDRREDQDPELSRYFGN